MSRLKRNRRIYFLVLYLIFTVCIMLVFRYYVNNQMDKHLTEQISKSSSQNLRRVDDKLKGKIEELDNLAIEIGSNEEYDYINSFDDLQRFANVLGFREIGIILPSGDAYMSTGKILNLKDRQYFLQALGGKSNISEIIIDRFQNQTVNVYAVPILDNKDNSVKGVLCGLQPADEFLEDFYSEMGSEPYMYILKPNGDIISKAEEKSGLSINNIYDILDDFAENDKVIDNIKNILENGQGDIINIKKDGYKYISLNPVGINDWWVMTVGTDDFLREKTVIIAEYLHIFNVGIAVITIVALLILLNIHKGREEKLEKIAYCDQFTSLYNKEYLKANFLDRLKKSSHKKVALVGYDINKMKMVNEIYGVQVGNYVIKHIANILKMSVKDDNEIVIRDHSDVFFALYMYDTKDELENRIDSVINKVSKIICNNKNMQLTMAVGIYELTNEEHSFEKSFSYAQMAKNDNKKNVEKGYSYYSQAMRETELRNKQLNDEIKEGIANKEFMAWFQPQYDTFTKKIVGAEALVRWYKSDGRIISPYYFIEFSEKTGLIQEIDRIVLENVCKSISQWREQGLDVMPISLNLSRAYLSDENAIYYIKNTLDKYNIPGDLIKLEVTESAIVDSEDKLEKIIEIMHKFSFRVYLDDFGIGYSSLSSINNLNFDTLKIDKSFVDTIGTEKGNRVIKYTIDLAKNLGMSLVAEGVETKEQYEFLKAEHCDVIQGYYFSKPLSASEFKEVLEENQKNDDKKVVD